MNVPPPSTVAVAPREGRWRRRIITPILSLLTQGVTADKIAQTLAIGGVCSMFPFIGTTWALNLVVGWSLRMNQPILQTLNQLLWFVHLPMILLYVHLGEWVWGATDDRFTIAEMVRVFRDATFGEFLHRFGWAGIHAFTAWALTAPLLFGLIYYPLRPVVRRVAGQRAPLPVP